VWAIDSSRAMGEYLRVKAASGGPANVETVLASAESLPLVDALADIVVSNYCMHELSDEGKRRALAEIMRVLKPGGRLVIGDMMFALNPLSRRDRTVVLGKVRAIAARGLPGLWRLAKNAGRLAAGRWESPADANWWREALMRAGFVGISVEPLSHEGGVASAYAPPREPQGSASIDAAPGTFPSDASRASEELRRLRYPSRNAVVTRSTIPS
jgi:SAM-dependent methyltransferase